MSKVDFNLLTEKKYLQKTPIDVIDFVPTADDMLEEIQKRRAIKKMIGSGSSWKQPKLNWDKLQSNFLKGSAANELGWKLMFLWFYFQLDAKEYGNYAEDAIIKGFKLEKISAQLGTGDALAPNGNIIEIKVSIGADEGCNFYALRVREYHPVDEYLLAWYCCEEDELWWILIPKAVMAPIISECGNVMANTKEYNEDNKNKEMRITIDRTTDCYKELLNYRLTTKELHKYCTKGSI